MKKILLSTSVIALVAIASIGATRAYFSSTQTSTGNTFTAGTLVANLSDGNSGAALNLGTLSNFAPGQETGTATLLIKNTGSLNFGWFGYFDLTGVTKDMDKAIYIKDAQMEFLNPSTGTWEATDHFIANGTGAGLYGAYYTTMANADPLHVISLRTWNNDNAMGAGGGVQMGALKPGYSYRLTLKLAMAPEAGNEYQGGTLGLQYMVKAGQLNASALNGLGSADARIVDNAGDLHLSWMETQISHQP